MLKSLFYIFLFLFSGEAVRYFFDLPVPGNVIAMMLIFFALKAGVLKLEAVKPASDKLIKYMVLFFVPYGVGLMDFVDVIKANWLSLTIAAVASTIITLYVTAIVEQKLEKDG
jgi:holin-like protein